MTEAFINCVRAVCGLYRRRCAEMFTLQDAAKRDAAYERTQELKLVLSQMVKAATQDEDLKMRIRAAIEAALAQAERTSLENIRLDFDE